MQHNPSESIRLVVERGYADYARSKFDQLAGPARRSGAAVAIRDALRRPPTPSSTKWRWPTRSPARTSPSSAPEDEKIVLSSVHQAKGLEWRIVFVIWLADGPLPVAARAARPRRHRPA